jgi:hypothetical protein
MLHQIRRQLRALAATMLVLVSTLGVWSTVAHGFDCHDLDGAPIVVVHDASAHAFRSAALPAGERPVHCVLCHWTRLLGPGVQSVAFTPFVASRPLAVRVARATVARLIAADQPPLRAPPSARPLEFLA